MSAAPVLVRLRVDDPVSVVAVHGVAGVWSMLALALFGRRDGLEVRIKG